MLFETTFGREMNPLAARKFSPTPRLSTVRPNLRPERTRLARQIGPQTVGAAAESRVALPPP